MISDEERKRVAANLRQYLKKYETPDWRAFCNIILGSGRLDNLRKAQAFDRLADLIDRETVELPRDADGVPIRIGDVLYSSGNECRVVSITVKADKACVGVHTDEGVFLPSVNPKYLSHKNTEPLEPESADSWEKLEEDARKTACAYAPAPRNEDGLTTCDGCPFLKSESCSNEMTIDLVERTKKLAGIEDGGSK